MWITLLKNICRPPIFFLIHSIDWMSSCAKWLIVDLPKNHRNNLFFYTLEKVFQNLEQLWRVSFMVNKSNDKMQLFVFCFVLFFLSRRYILIKKLNFIFSLFYLTLPALCMWRWNFAFDFNTLIDILELRSHRFVSLIIQHYNIPETSYKLISYFMLLKIFSETWKILTNPFYCE